MPQDGQKPSNSAQSTNSNGGGGGVSNVEIQWLSNDTFLKNARAPMVRRSDPATISKLTEMMTSKNSIDDSNLRSDKKSPLPDSNIHPSTRDRSPESSSEGKEEFPKLKRTQSLPIPHQQYHPRVSHSDSLTSTTLRSSSPSGARSPKVSGSYTGGGGWFSSLSQKLSRNKHMPPLPESKVVESTDKHKHNININNGSTKSDYSEDQIKLPPLSTSGGSSSYDDTGTGSAYSPGSPSTAGHGLFHHLRRLSFNKHIEEPPPCVMNRNYDRPVCPLKRLQNLDMKKVHFRVDLLQDEPAQLLPHLKRKPCMDDRTASAKSSSRHQKSGMRMMPSSSSSGTILSIPGAETSPIVSSSDEGTIVNSNHQGENADQNTLDPSKLTIDKATKKTSWSSNVQGQDNVKPPSPTKPPASTTTTTTTEAKQSASVLKPLPTKSHVKPKSKPDGTDLGVIYTRCCHLREIMPIKSTLAQVAGKHGYVKTLKLCNRNPTMIEVLAFSDFISITDIKCISLDRVNLSPEMVKTIFSALVWSRHVEKLQLSDCFLDDKGWEILCYLLTMNKYIQSLDISMRDGPLDVGLFVSALKVRGSLEELIMNGIIFTDGHLLQILNACSAIGTRRLGLASTNIQEKELEGLIEWANIGKNGDLKGVDLGGNDLSKSITLMTNGLMNNETLAYISFASTNLQRETFLPFMMKVLPTWKGLKFLDISSNPDLFVETSSPTICSLLVGLKELKRIHLKYDNISSEQAINLAETIPKCKSLVHVNLIGNKISSAAVATLVESVRISGTLYNLELDPGMVDPYLNRRLLHYSVRNMEKGIISVDDYEDDADGAALFKSGHDIAQAVELCLREQQDLGESGSDMVRLAIVERAQNIQKLVSKKIDSLEDKRLNGEYKMPDFESSLRYQFLSNTLSNVLNQVCPNSLKGQQKQQNTPSAAANGVATDTARSVVEDNDEERVENLTPEDTDISVNSRAQIQEEGALHRIGSFLSKARQNPATNKKIESMKLPSGQEIQEALKHIDVNDVLSKLESGESVLDVFYKKLHSSSPANDENTSTHGTRSSEDSSSTTDHRKKPGFELTSSSDSEEEVDKKSTT